MAMLLDGPPSTIEDLTCWDSDLLNLAASEGIDLTAKLELAAGAISRAVETMLISALPSYGAIRHFPEVRHIAVTPPLKQWHTCATLRLIYQDLYYSRLNDRYKAKMTIFRDEESQALDDLRTTGLGVVYDPLPQALPPNVGSAPTSDVGGSMYVAITFVNQRGEEGLISIPVEVDTPDGTAATLTLAALADNAVGWNLYAGLLPDQLTRQNSQRLEPMASPQLAPGRLSTGAKPNSGQHANVLHPVPRRILRG